MKSLREMSVDALVDANCYSSADMLLVPAHAITGVDHSTPPLRCSLQPPKHWQNWNPWMLIQTTFTSCFVWRRIRDKKMIQQNLIPSMSTLLILNRQ